MEYKEINVTLSEKQLTTTMYFVEILIPDLKEDIGEKSVFLQHFNTYLEKQGVKVQKQLALLISVMNYLCIFYKGRTFNSCNDRQKESFVEKLFYFPIPKLVSGVTGLRTLCLFTYYAHADQWKKLNYDGPIKR